MSDFDWQDQPRKATIKCGSGIYSERFRTTKSETYRGYFGLVALAVRWRVWL